MAKCNERVVESPKPEPKKYKYKFTAGLTTIHVPIEEYIEEFNKKPSDEKLHEQMMMFQNECFEPDCSYEEIK